MSGGPTNARCIALVGLRCSGKTSVGRELARELELGFVDLDDAVAWSAGEGCCAEHAPTVAEIVGEVGWEGFRDLEQRELARVLGGPSVLATGGLVLATGGGVVEREANRARLREGARCVWLREDLDVLRERLRSDRESRPALGGRDPVSELDEVAARREPLYRDVAELAVEAGGRSPAEIAREIALRLAVR